MSAIAGLITFDGSPVAPTCLGAMLEAMDYRGPDGCYPWTGQADKGIALGYCQLVTTPEAKIERQPLASKNGDLVLVFDGRLDNRDALISGLELAQPGLPDADLVLMARRRWKDHWLAQLDGDFALALWDSQDRSLTCACDRFGNRSLHYYWNGRRFVFATDVHAILGVDGVPAVPDNRLLGECLGLEWRSVETTFWEQVYRLPGANRLRVTERGVELHRYWEPDCSRQLNYPDVRDYAAHYRTLLLDTVRRQSRTQAPVSVDVSGGLDSSGIFAAASALHHQGQLQAPALQGYTLNFEGHPRADEISCARAVARHTGRSVTEIPPAFVDFNWYLQQARRFLDLPGYPNSTMAHEELQSIAGSGSRVLLNGLGGDEWLGARGYSYDELLRRVALTDVCRLVSRQWSEQGSLHTARSITGGLARTVLPTRLVQKLTRYRQGQPAWLSHTLSESWLQPENVPVRRGYWPGQSALCQQLHSAAISRARQIDERYAATFGLETRNPYYSTAMVEFSFALPNHLKQVKGLDKYLHRQALSMDLPDEVLQRSDKAEFSVVFHHYRERVVEYLADLRLDRLSGWVKPDEVRLMRDQFGQQSEPDHVMPVLWHLIMCDALYHGDTLS